MKKAADIFVASIGFMLIISEAGWLVALGVALCFIALTVDW